MTLGDEDNGTKDNRLERNEEEEGEEREDNVTRWEKEKTDNRRVQEIRQQINLERGLARTPPRKRTSMKEDNNQYTPSSGKKEKTEDNSYVPSTGYGLGLRTTTHTNPRYLPTTPKSVWQ